MKDFDIDLDFISGGWKNKKAESYKNKVIRYYGKPNTIGKDIVIWNYGEGKIIRTIVRDEHVPHNFPMPHLDFVYSVMKIPKWKAVEGKSVVNPEMVETLAKVSGSIIVDGLRGEIIARCGKILNNGVTLGFVEDLINKKIHEEDAKKEYAHRIENSILPDWFPNILKE